MNRLFYDKLRFDHWINNLTSKNPINFFFNNRATEIFLQQIVKKN